MWKKSKNLLNHFRSSEHSCTAWNMTPQIVFLYVSVEHPLPSFIFLICSLRLCCDSAATHFSSCVVSFSICNRKTMSLENENNAWHVFSRTVICRFHWCAIVCLLNYRKCEVSSFHSRTLWITYKWLHTRMPSRGRCSATQITATTNNRSILNLFELNLFTICTKWCYIIAGAGGCEDPSGMNAEHFARTKSHNKRDWCHTACMIAILH